MEIEAKFRIDEPSVFATLLAIRTIGRHSFETSPDAEIQENVYFDTASGRIRRSESALRVRTVGCKRIASVKGPTRTIGVLHERGEWEVEIGEDSSPSTWPSGEARDRALQLAGFEELRPIVRVLTTRRHIYVSDGGVAFAEICLDEGTIEADERSISFREVEIEALTEDRRAAFDDLVKQLQNEYALVPETKSKFARGLELLPMR